MKKRTHNVRPYGETSQPFEGEDIILPHSLPCYRRAANSRPYGEVVADLRIAPRGETKKSAGEIPCRFARY